MGIVFYCGVNEKKWNYHPVSPGQYACIAPVYGKTRRTKRCNSVTVPSKTMIIQDSGAFSDGPTERLTFEDAFDRQIEHASRYGYSSQITHIASYDLLIDEKWQGGIRQKARWTVQEAELAVDDTIRAAEFMARRRNGTGLILSAQGVDVDQYAGCVRRIAPLLENGDILGLGGWCIVGKMPKRMMMVFRRVIQVVIPIIARAGIKQVHIWGVIYAPALGELLWMCDQYEIELSTDSAGPSVRPAAFGEWGYGDWKDPEYVRAPVEKRGLERARHVQAVRDWLDRLEETQYYKEPVAELEQLRLWRGFCGC